MLFSKENKIDARKDRVLANEGCKTGLPTDAPTLGARWCIPGLLLSAYRYETPFLRANCDLPRVYWLRYEQLACRQADQSFTLGQGMAVALSP
jgi:hypothetical protein